MEIDLAGRRVLVTGASSGIGQAIARAMGAAGASVAINHLASGTAAQAVATGVDPEGRRTLVLEADVSDPAQVAAMFGRVEAAWGGVDILVNNAGMDGPRALAWEADPASWVRVVEVNLVGAFLCAREALRGMVTRKSGVIINVTSVHEQIAWAGYSAYTASKAGLSMLGRTLAQEAAPHGVRVLNIAPGAIRTAINRAVWSDPAGERDLLQKIPLGRMGLPEEIANMAVVLASDSASYVTGSTVFVDGAMIDYPAFQHGG